MIKKKIKRFIPKGAQVEFYDNSATFEVSPLEIKKVAHD